MTNYGFNDNSCQTEGQHDCGLIAYPGVGPNNHQQATEGTGTYDDPITAAAADQNNPESAGGADLTPGTIIYNTLTQKYYVMEDSCAECSADWACQYDDDQPHSADNPPASCQPGTFLHIDFWMGPTVSQQAPANLINCEGNASVGDVYNLNMAMTGPLTEGTTNGTVIINPPNNLPVRTGILFAGDSSANGGCFTSTQLLPNQMVCK
jgi:hypothetical protein